MIDLMISPASQQYGVPHQDTIDDVLDRIAAMQSQEETTYNVIGQSTIIDNQIHCREKMLTWSFHLIDHYNLSREIVEISFSYLDRFVMSCNCDKTSFKLASMTTLYVASKNIGPKCVSLRTLTELSEGEFDTNHFVQMEQVILESLEWRLQPPTIQAYLHHFLMLLHPVCTNVSCEGIFVDTTQHVFEQALYFSELSLFDFDLCKERKKLIALGSILNALYFVYPENTAEELSTNIKNDLIGVLDPVLLKVGSIQQRLQDLFFSSKEYRASYTQDKKFGILRTVAKSAYCKYDIESNACISDCKLSADNSPVSVLTKQV